MRLPSMDTKYRWLLLTKTISVTVYTSPTVLLFLLANYTLISLVNSLDFYHMSSELVIFSPAAVLCLGCSHSGVITSHRFWYNRERFSQAYFWKNKWNIWVCQAECNSLFALIQYTLSKNRPWAVNVFLMSNCNGWTKRNGSLSNYCDFV